MLAVSLVLITGVVLYETGQNNSSGEKKGQKETLASEKDKIKEEITNPEEILQNIGEEEYKKEELAMDDSSENEKIEESGENVQDDQNGTRKKNSRYPYYIKVNRQANCVTVYGQDANGEYTVPVKAMVCSVGVANATPLGTFKTSDKYAWRYLFGDVYGQYAYRIDGHILFHSVPYYSKNKGDLESEEYNKLGEAASLGCVRLSVADAKWLIDNCPSGTTVTIYDSPDPGPLGKPTAIKIDLTSPYKGWDPTDPAEGNPWVNASPVFTGLEDKTINKGSAFSALDGVNARDFAWRDLTDKIVVNGTVDTSKEGNYTLQYVVYDAYGNHASKTITITVKNAKGPDISLPQIIEVNIENNKNLVEYLKGKAVVTQDGIMMSKDGLQIDTSPLQGKTTGDYAIAFTAKDANGNASTAYTTIRLDLEAPIIDVPSQVIVNSAEMNIVREKILSQIKITDAGNTVDAQKASLDLTALEGQEYGEFSVNCQYTDAAGNRTEAVIKVLLDTEAPVITSSTQNLCVSDFASIETEIKKTIQIHDNSGMTCAYTINCRQIENKAPVYQYEVTVQTNDQAGNHASGTFVYRIQVTT